MGRALVPLLAALALCPIAALAIGDDPTGPVARGGAMLAVERDLGIAVEPAVHGWARGHPALMAAAGVFYVVAHIGVAGWALIWTWALRRDAFARLRAVFVTAQLMLVGVYVAIPTAPPRLLAGQGFEDTLSDLWGKEAAGSAHTVQSAFAAMPSGHVAFALIAGIAFARLGDQPWLRAFGWLYPPVMAAVTLATANHYVLDVAAAGVVAGAAWLLTGRLERLRGRRGVRLRPSEVSG